jgi:N-formylglutamate deformylase
MILHVPHASSTIPDQFRDQYILSDDELTKEHLGLTDAYTDELFQNPAAQVVCFPYSRLLVDVERFQSDDQEPMSKVGMGMIYTQTISGRPLRRSLSKLERTNLENLYDKHHLLLTRSVKDELVHNEKSLIVDCHSFPSKPLTCDIDQSSSRPDICLGVDDFHTPGSLVITLKEAFKSLGLSVKINQPYAGTIVPLKWYAKEHRVHSVMIEINRSLYMNESTGKKLEYFTALRNELSQVLGRLDVIPNEH